MNLKPGEPPALVRKAPGKPLEVLGLITSETHYEAQWNFYGSALRTVGEAFPNAPFVLDT